MDLIALYRAILDKADHKGPSLPVIYNGTRGPRLIGYAIDADSVEGCLFEQRLTATYISRAFLAGDDRKFYVAHG